MTDLTRYKAVFERLSSQLDYWRDVAMNEFAIEVGERMARLELSRADLARRLGTSQAYVTKVLGGNINFTIETMVKLAMALNGALHLHISDYGSMTRWNDTSFTADSSRPTTFRPEIIETGVETRPDDKRTAEVDRISATWA